MALLTALIAAATFSVQGACARLVSVSDLPAFPTAGRTVVSLPAIDPGIDWDEAIVSWNVRNPESAALTLEARVVRPEGTTKWYSYGRWTGAVRRSTSASVNDQKDADGNMLTDTLRLAKRGGKLELRLTLDRLEGPSAPKLKLLTVSFCDRAAKPLEREPNRAAWGRVIEVRQVSQMTYEYGKLGAVPGTYSEGFGAWLAGLKTCQFCSPTAVSMLLSRWSQALNRADLDKSVADVAIGVFDAAWPGTGNWPFNTAYIGSLPGMVSYVSRLESITDLEDLIVAGVPVVTSVDYNVLQANGKKEGVDGHVLVLIGFDKDGDPVFNDPGWSKDVRQTYKRANFERAWAFSRRTVYLAYPEGHRLPAARSSGWISG